MAKKKKNSSGAFWWIIIVLVVIVAFFMLSGGGEAADIDYSKYDYTDAELAKTNTTNTVVLYEDFQCPACKSFQPTVKTLKADPDVEVIYKHFPLSSIHPYARTAAEASECARDQGRFWAYHDVLYDNQQYLAKGYLKDHAEGLGLDMDEFNSCLDGREKQVLVARHLQEGTLDGVTGTPSVFVNGVKVQNSLSAIQARLQ